MPAVKPFDPFKIAIIDIGSNSVKLRIYRVLSPTEQEILFEDKSMIRLGAYVYRLGILPPDAADQVCEVLDRYRELIATFEARDVLVKATASVRDAANRDEFIQSVRSRTGLDMELVSGDEEAHYVYLASLGSIEYGDRVLMLCDIGGGSTEVLFASKNRIFASESISVGTVRLKEMFFSGHDEEKRYKAKYVRTMEAYCAEKFRILSKSAEQYQPAMILAFGGTATAMVELAERVGQMYSKLGCRTIAKADVEAFYRRFRQSSIAKIRAIDGMQPSRADIILEGCLILKMLSDIGGCDDIAASPKGLREGIMIDYVSRYINADLLKQKQSHIRVHALKQCGKKYQIHESHGEQVSRLSTMLFYELQELHKLDLTALPLLTASAYLHDIGAYIEYKEHHKHSYYLIVHSDLVGFSAEEKEIIGLIARYHRKSFPHKRHRSFSALSDEQKRIVWNLACILRLADSLDRGYKNNVQSVRCVVDSVQRRVDVVIVPSPRRSVLLESWSFEAKKSMAEEYWQYRINARIG